MTENYGVIYRDKLEPEYAELREWFELALGKNVLLVYKGEAWYVKNIVLTADSFVAEGSYVNGGIG